MISNFEADIETMSEEERQRMGIYEVDRAVAKRNEVSAIDISA